jgi:hypothetical protein
MSGPITPTDIYIDEVFINADGTSAYTGGENLLFNATSAHGDVSKTTGWKWVVQITNGSDATINFATHKLILNVCVNFKNDEVESSELDTNFEVTSGTLASGASIYIGHGLFSGTVTVTDPASGAITGSNYLLPDQEVGGNIVAASRMKLYLTSTVVSNWKDTAGRNNHNTSGDHTNSLVLLALANSWTRGDSMLRRKATGDWHIPEQTMTNSHWQITVESTATEAEDNYLLASVAGDPHMKTLNGEHYEFDYLGAFRMFEYLKNGNSIIINGLAETGPGRWKTKQYVRKIFIQNNNLNILLDMGFRGSPVKVLENNGITYKEKTLPFDKKAKRYNFDNTMSTLDLDEPITENLPGLIRNQLDIIVEINNDTEKNHTEKNELSFITLQNVNEYNLQPCRLEINMSKKLIGPAKGCLIDRKYATVSKLNKITDVTPLEEPTLEDLKNIPELEIEPQKRNIMWK